MTKEARIYEGGKTVSSMSDVRKAGQQHVTQWNENIPSHCVQK